MPGGVAATSPWAIQGMTYPYLAHVFFPHTWQRSPGGWGGRYGFHRPRTFFPSLGLPPTLSSLLGQRVAVPGVLVSPEASSRSVDPCLVTTASGSSGC